MDDAEAADWERMKPKPGLISVSCTVSHKLMHYFCVFNFPQNTACQLPGRPRYSIFPQGVLSGNAKTYTVYADITVTK